MKIQKYKSMKYGLEVWKYGSMKVWSMGVWKYEHMKYGSMNIWSIKTCNYESMKVQKYESMVLGKNGIREV